MGKTSIKNLFTNRVLDAIRTTGYQSPDKLAIIETNGREFTYACLWADVQAYAIGLQQRHAVKAGDRILVIVRPGYNAVAVIMGIIAAGAVPVVADTAMGYDVFVHRVLSAEPRLIIVEPLLLQMKRFSFAASVIHRAMPDLPDIRLFGDRRCISLNDCKALPHTVDNISNDKSQTYERLPQDSPQIIVFTSGTTSKPKAVVHSVRSIESLIATTGQALDATHGERLYSSQLYLIVPALARAMTMIVPTSTTITVRQLHNHLTRFSVNQLFAAPAQVQDLMSAFSKASFPDSLHCLMLGSAPVTSGFLQRVSKLYKGTVWCVYGMTELLPIAMVRSSDKLLYNKPGDLLGAIVKGVTFRVADDGEMYVGGKSLCNGYLGSPTVREVGTGDIVRIDQDGALVLLGRKKDMIIRREYNIYPGLYEPIISRIPGVEQCAMVGYFDESVADEKVVLYVEGTIGEKQLRKQLESGAYSIDTTALPDRIEFVNVIPRIGRQLKPNKQLLREWAVQ